MTVLSKLLSEKIICLVKSDNVKRLVILTINIISVILCVYVNFLIKKFFDLNYWITCAVYKLKTFMKWISSSCTLQYFVSKHNLNIEQRNIC